LDHIERGAFVQTRIHRVAGPKNISFIGADTFSAFISSPRRL
jgi:hypothetical protein